MGTKPISLAQLLDKQLAQGQAGGNTLLLPANVAGLTGLTVAKLARLRRSGRGPAAIRFGRYYLYRYAAVLAWIDQNKMEASHGA